MARRPEAAQVRLADVAFRHTKHETPLWVPANTEDGRWNEARSHPTQYLALSPDGCWADLIRREVLRTESAVSQIGGALWMLKINEERIADYRAFEHAHNAGFQPEALIDDDWERCQAEARRLQELGFRGVLAPSAALPGETNLTLFGPRRAVDWERRVAPASAVIPVKIVTVGAPPHGLIERVRFRGEEHGGYAAYAGAQRKSRR